MPTFIGSVQFEGPHASPDTTIEALTLHVNPSTGSDFSIFYRMNRQSDFTAHGPFASFKGALDALPSSIRHAVHVLHAPGTFVITDWDYMGDYSRFKFFWNGYLVLDSENGLVPCAGTSTMTLGSSSDGGWTVTTASDPGLTPNAFRSKYLRVSSGAGAGQYKPIRSHSGSTFNVAGRFAPIDGTSVLEIVEPSTTLRCASPYAYIYGNGQHSSTIDFTAGPTGYGIVWGALTLDATDTYGAMLWPYDLMLTFEGTTLLGIEMWLAYSYILLNTSITDGNGKLYSCALQCDSGSTISSGTSEAGWLIRNSPWGILVGAYQVPKAYLYKGAIDDCTYDAILVCGGELLYLQDHLRGSNIGGYAVNLGDATVLPSAGPTGLLMQSYTAGWSSIPGTLGEVCVDGAVSSYADLVAAPDKVVKGKYNSIARAL